METMKTKIYTLESESIYQKKLKKLIENVCPDAENSFYQSGVKGILDLNENGGDIVIAGQIGGLFDYQSLKYINREVELIVLTDENILPYHKVQLAKNQYIKKIHQLNRGDVSFTLQSDLEKILH